MANSFHALEWHVLEDEGKAEEQWPSLVDDDASPPQLVTVPQFQHLYELLFLIVVVLGIVAGLLWQRADQRIAQLETDLTALHEEFAQSQRQKVLKGTSDGWVSTIGNQPQPQRNSIFRCGG